MNTTINEIESQTIQSKEVLIRWNKTKIIPKGTYFTNNEKIAEDYYSASISTISAGTYLIPEDKVFFISEFGDIKEFVTLEDISLKSPPRKGEDEECKFCG